MHTSYPRNRRQIINPEGKRMNENARNILLKYLPEQRVDFVIDFLAQHQVQFEITPHRAAKLGTCYYPGKINFFRIDINNDLNSHMFFLVFLHEAAHLLTRKKYQDKVTSHGREWQNTYRVLARKHLTEDVFPRELLPRLNHFFSRKSIPANAWLKNRIFDEYHASN